MTACRLLALVRRLARRAVGGAAYGGIMLAGVSYGLVSLALATAFAVAAAVVCLLVAGE